jgi:hypothetical protein
MKITEIFNLGRTPQDHDHGWGHSWGWGWGHGWGWGAGWGTGHRWNWDRYRWY